MNATEQWKELLEGTKAVLYLIFSLGGQINPIIGAILIIGIAILVGKIGLSKK